MSSPVRVPIIFKASSDFGGAMSESAAHYIRLTNARKTLRFSSVITSAITDNGTDQCITGTSMRPAEAGSTATHDWSLPV